MRSALLVLGLAGLALSGLIACGDDDDEATPTPEPTATEAAPTPTPTLASQPSPTNTPPPTNTPRPTPSPTASEPATPPADGTIDPLNPGDTAPKTLKPNPSNFQGPAVLVDVRISVHPEVGGWERIVFELDSAGIPATVIEYRDSVALCGSGQEVTVPDSRAALVITMQSTAAHDQQGQITLRSGEIELDGPPNGTIVAGRQICDFEAVVSWAFGLKGERNFKVSTLENPFRILVDLKR